MTTTTNQKKTTSRTRKKSTQTPRVVIKKSNKESMLEEEDILRIELSKMLGDVQEKLERLIELQRDLGTSDRTRFCKLERALRRNMEYTNLVTI